MELFLLFSIILTIVAFISIISTRPPSPSPKSDSDMDINFMAATTSLDNRNGVDVSNISFVQADVYAEAITDEPIPQDNSLQINSLA